MIIFPGQMMWHYMGWGMIFWALILVGLGYLLWLSFRSRRSLSREQDPLEIARTRLAQGEITPEEYDHIKSKLEESGS
jgi:uncharacterized membrane protein